MKENGHEETKTLHLPGEIVPAFLAIEIGMHVLQGLSDQMKAINVLETSSVLLWHAKNLASYRDKMLEKYGTSIQAPTLQETAVINKG